MNTKISNVHYVQERLGSEATCQDAELVLDLAAALAAEQGDDNYNAIDWLNNRTYPWTTLYEAAQGDVAALALVRSEAGLSMFA